MIIIIVIALGIGTYFFIKSQKKQQKQHFKDEEEWIWNRPKNKDTDSEPHVNYEEENKKVDSKPDNELPKPLFSTESDDGEHIITTNVSIESDSFQGQSSDKIHPLTEINKNTKDQVSFPGAYDPTTKYYLTEVSFQPQFQNEVEYKKGKKGHYVRNTLLFGIAGTILTHSKDGKVISKQVEVPALGYLKLVSTDFKNNYMIPFTAFKAKADELKNNYMIDGKEFDYLKEQSNK